MNRKEFKERVLGLFNKYKDKPLGSVERFNNEIYLKYGFIPSSRLYSNICEYQVKKYGGVIELFKTTDKLFVANFNHKSRKCRNTANENARKNHQANRNLKRLEREKEEALKLEAKSYKKPRRVKGSRYSNID